MARGPASSAVWVVIVPAAGVGAGVTGAGAVGSSPASLDLWIQPETVTRRQLPFVPVIVTSVPLTSRPWLAVAWSAPRRRRASELVRAFRAAGAGRGAADAIVRVGGASPCKPRTKRSE